ncbi:MAG TPA: hypothetical protein VFS33_03135 [Gemmatimonadales bacterium]|nr:hypothetical protein [Gemmatimonadales bacterium]
MGRVPQHEGKFAAQPVQAVRAKILVEVEGNLAVGSGAEMVPLLLQLALNRLEAIELAVHDELHAIVLARDWLLAGGEVDDSQARVAEADLAVGRHPDLLPVGPAMM